LRLISSSKWFQCRLAVEGDNSTDHDDDPLLPDSYLYCAKPNGRANAAPDCCRFSLDEQAGGAILASASQQQIIL